MLALSSLLFVIGFFGMFTGVNLIGASQTAMIMNLEPVLTIVFAVLLLEEGLNLPQSFGAALVILAIFVFQGLKYRNHSSLPSS